MVIISDSDAVLYNEADKPDDGAGVSLSKELLEAFDNSVIDVFSYPSIGSLAELIERIGPELKTAKHNTAILRRNLFMLNMKLAVSINNLLFLF